VCPTGSIEEDRRGYRVLVGGKLGRHPRLGTELPELASPQMVLEVVHRCIEHHLRHCQGERFGEVIERTGLDFLRR
jgi:dissimilatory sulfite reductase (desulfoviridin) alpha/beta subunit